MSPLPICEYASVTLSARAWSHVDAREDGCWIWTGASEKGYGRMRVGGKSRLTHRQFYVSLVGPVPTSLVLDHLCRNTLCVNPAHLEPVTHDENVRRGKVNWQQRAKTHCRSGHQFSPENTYLTPKGHRSCRACNLAARERYVIRLRERATA